LTRDIDTQSIRNTRQERTLTIIQEHGGTETFAFRAHIIILVAQLARVIAAGYSGQVETVGPDACRELGGEETICVVDVVLGRLWGEACYAGRMGDGAVTAVSVETGYGHEIGAAVAYAVWKAVQRIADPIEQIVLFRNALARHASGIVIEADSTVGIDAGC